MAIPFETLGKELVVEVTIDAPTANASSTGRPKPSNNDQNTKTVAPAFGNYSDGHQLPTAGYSIKMSM